MTSIIPDANMSILLFFVLSLHRANFPGSCWIPTHTQIHIHTGRIHYKTTYACEGKQLDLSCDEGKMIHLVRANYGRFSLSICNPSGQLDLSVNCMSFRSFLIMQDRCSQSSNCSVVVSSKIFGDPCPGTSKYLEVQYHCVHPSAVGSPDSPTILTSGSGMAPAAGSTRRPDPGRDFMDYIEPAKPSSSAASPTAESEGLGGMDPANDLTGIKAPYETTSSAHPAAAAGSPTGYNYTTASTGLQVPPASPLPTPTSPPRVPNVSASSRIATTTSYARRNNEDTMRILQSMMTSAPTEFRRPAVHHRPSHTEILKAIGNNQPIPPRPEISMPSWLETSVHPTGGSSHMTIGNRDQGSRVPSPIDPGMDLFPPDKDGSGSGGGSSHDSDQMSHQSEGEDDDMVIMAIGLFFIVFFTLMGSFGLIYWMFKSENTTARKFVRSIPMIHCILGSDPELDMDSEKVSSVVQSAAYGTTTTTGGFPIVETSIPTQITSTNSPNNNNTTLWHQYHQHQLQQQQLYHHHHDHQLQQQQQQHQHQQLHHQQMMQNENAAVYGTTTTTSGGFPIVRTHVPTHITANDSPNSQVMSQSYQYHRHQLQQQQQQQQLHHRQMMQNGNDGVGSSLRLYNVSTGKRRAVLQMFHPPQKL